MPATTVDRPAPGVLVARARRRRHTLGAAVTAGLALAVVVVLAWTLTLGSAGISPWDALRSALHLGSDPATDFIVRELRLPRALTSVLVGLALGVAGTVFQRLLGNTLASPDVLGISAGAGTAAVAALVLADLAGVGVSLLALVGALGTALLVYVLAWRRGVQGYRFILVGVGVAAFLSSITSYLVSRAEISDARAAMLWLTGSSGLAGPAQIATLAAGLVVLLPLALVLERRLVVIELGDDAALALGVHVERDRRALMLLGVALVALATAAAGPIAFVALMAGPVARRLVGGRTGDVLAAACVGALLMQLADVVAQEVMPSPLPTGVVTGLVGAPYVIWLLLAANRRGSAA
ncbi:iron chelate uptake ABC transporter family permease subunit [Cellulomonas sp. DKR-3]|uniref:Iron chelate uptake ABC transporter family permease subunit n=1 Tax=Cellulomonas fulva TaxID=2835530 RepID=A0ABS5TWY4_9CELL|nr:iron chelate uptake ABC transporter family permease subunit [Cellulomonas fulva]